MVWTTYRVPSAPNVLNYWDFMLAKFKKDLAESMTWQLPAARGGPHLELIDEGRALGLDTLTA